jgi:hypothetical protein
MGRKKNPENKSRIDDIREKLEESKMNSKSMNNDEPTARDEFSLFWTRVRKEYNRSKDIEPVLWAHLKSIGHDKPELFEAGLKHFGLKK